LPQPPTKATPKTTCQTDKELRPKEEIPWTSASRLHYWPRWPIELPDQSCPFIRQPARAYLPNLPRADAVCCAIWRKSWTGKCATGGSMPVEGVAVCSWRLDLNELPATNPPEKAAAVIGNLGSEAGSKSIASARDSIRNTGRDFFFRGPKRESMHHRPVPFQNPSTTEGIRHRPHQMPFFQPCRPS
jgi:hypothetical protein